MIDIHAHILPKLEDGSAQSMQDSLELVRTAMEDGIHTIVCTPRMGPTRHLGIDAIRKRFFRFCSSLQECGYPVTLKLGADIDFTPDLFEQLQQGQYLTLNKSRYFLLRLPQTAPSTELEKAVFACLEGGYVPIITHPERLSWISSDYKRLCRLIEAGAWLHVTGDSLTGHLGRLPKYWSERLLEEGWVHLVATDAHARDRRAAMLSDAFEFASSRLGQAEARQLVETRPQAVLNDSDPMDVALPPALVDVLGHQAASVF